MVKIRVVCPSASLDEKINKNFQTITYGKYVFKKNATISEKVYDLETAFLDKDIDLIICGRGGFNVNEILPYINYKLIKKNKKIICGYSDITALLLTLYFKCNLSSYLGPNLKELNEKYFENGVLIYRKFYKINDEDIINYGYANGIILAGNLCTINLLQGTKFIKKRKKVILFLEEDDNYKDNTLLKEFDRNLESLLQTNIFEIKALILGKFETNIKKEDIINLLKRKKVKDIPIIMNFPIGHIKNMEILPIGKNCEINLQNNNSYIKID